MLVQQFTRTTVRIAKPPLQFPLVSGNHQFLVGSTNKGQVMTSSILMKMFVCMGGSLCAVRDACEFDDDLIRHFRVIRRAQCMNIIIINYELAICHESYPLVPSVFFSYD